MDKKINFVWIDIFSNFEDNAMILEIEYIIIKKDII